MHHTENRGPDIVFEATGGEVCARCLTLLAELGAFVIYSTRTVKDLALGPGEVARLSMKNQSLTGFSIGRYLSPEGIRTGMTRLFKLLSEGKVRATISARYPLSEAAEAHRALESRDTVGKVLLIVESA
jgi:NADPH2:quinone reductase